MNFDKYTERARGFVQAAQGIALRENHQQFTPEHLLKALIDHTRTHFRREEALLRSKGYNGLKEHKALHRAMADKLVRLRKDYERGADKALGGDPLEFLCT